MNKRGLSPDIFKWILGIFAGAVILIFFVRFSYQHMDVSDVLQVRELLEHLDDQLEAFGIAESSSKTIALPESVKIQFLCDAWQTGDYTKKTNRILFAPPYLEDKSLDAWTEEWNYPFTIANFYYLSNDEVRHILVFDDTSYNQVITLNIPRIFNLQMMHAKDFDINQIMQQSNAKQQLNLVFFGTVPHPSQLLERQGPRVNLVEVNLNTKEIVYHNDNTRMYYFGDAMLYGAVFAPENFDCLKTKAITQLHRVARIHAEKAKLLQLKTLDPTCVNTLAQAHSTLQTYSTLTNEQHLFDYRNTIAQQNNLLEKHDCATLY